MLCVSFCVCTFVTVKCLLLCVSAMQLGGSLDPELEELFDDLRDSGDLDLVLNKAEKKEKRAGRDGAGVCVLCTCVRYVCVCVR